MGRESLADIIREKEREEKLVHKEKVPVVKRITGEDGAKNKWISAKVNDKVYAQFAEINKRYGITNNSSINQLIFRYVMENKDMLEEKF